MNETIDQQQRRIAGFMHCVAKALCGPAVNQKDFIDRVELLVGGSAANPPTLLHWGERVGRSGRPILLFSPSAEPAVPFVTLVAHVDGHTHMVGS